MKFLSISKLLLVSLLLTVAAQPYRAATKKNADDNPFEYSTQEMVILGLSAFAVFVNTIFGIGTSGLFSYLLLSAPVNVARSNSGYSSFLENPKLSMLPISGLFSFFSIIVLSVIAVYYINAVHTNPDDAKAGSKN